jgi:hypothetical protein
MNQPAAPAQRFIRGLSIIDARIGRYRAGSVAQPELASDSKKIAPPKFFAVRASIFRIFFVLWNEPKDWN